MDGELNKLKKLNEIIGLLIAKGADVNAMNDYGETPLDKAEENRLTKIAELLRKYGGTTKRGLKAEAKK